VAVTDFPIKAAVIVRDDLAVWQRLNVTGFLVSGLIGSAEDRVVGEDYIDADGKHYLPMLVQPLLVLEASAAKLQNVRRLAAERDVPIAIYTAELFSTGRDDANREAVRAVSTDDLDLVGIGARGTQRHGRDPSRIAPRRLATPAMRESAQGTFPHAGPGDRPVFPRASELRGLCTPLALSAHPVREPIG